MFWRFGGYSNISTIDTLLEKPSTTLEDLLEEQDLIQELKSHHTKLIEFIRNDDHLKQLLTYVVAPGPETDGDEDLTEPDDTPVDEEKDKAEKKRLKYAFVACEILSCETWSITEALMANIDDLRDFWDFVKKPAPLDPLQAGYFTKVNETLLEKKTEEMLDFFKSLPNIVPALLQHVDCPMVMDLLLKIISLEKAEGGAGIVEWLHDQDLIPDLLNNLSPSCNSSTQTSAGDFLKAIITISANAAQNEQSCIGPNSLTRQLVSDACIRQLISQMLNGGNPLTVGVGIIIEVIRKNNSDYDPDNGQNPGAPPTTHDPIYLGTLLRAFATHVPDFMNLILSSKHSVTDGEKTKQVDRGTLKSAWGTDIEPLGFDRFKTCELMAELLHCSNMALLNERGSEQYVKTRDDQRQKLLAAGALPNSKQEDDGAIDTSMTVIPLDSSFDQSLGAPTEDLRDSAQSDEDGFEKVLSVGAREDKQADKPEDSHISSTTSPTSGITDNVRRLSLEDVHMAESDVPAALPTAAKSGDSSPHPEDRPAPLFSKTDSHKAPTSASSDAQSSLLNDSSMSGVTASQSSEIDTEGQGSSSDEPVVGDYLKMQFVENKVVPTILSFFFRFPWNNFLHNVVYDVVQQVFNGPMDRGHNKYLAFDLFETGKITEQIINGQNRSEESERTKSMRLGYMGHLTLVAEEVVKFGERQPREALAEAVQNSIYGRDWEDYVTKTLAETRERDNAILGGFRPENGLGPRQAVLNAVNAGSGFSGSNALAQVGLTGGQQGLENVDLSNNGSATSAAFSSSGGSLLSGFGSSSDDEDEDMEDDSDSQTRSAIHAVQLSAADTGASADSDQPIPLLPPPPAPLNIEPSRARRRLAERLTHRQQQQEQEAAASEFGMEEDPFAALDDNDNDNDDPFSLDEEEQDITSFGKRVNSSSNRNGGEAGSSSTASRSIHGLFSSGFGQHRDQHRKHGALQDSSSSSDSDDEADHPPEEARTSLKRRPLDIDDEIDEDDDDDDEMGEMVAPGDGPNSSDDEEVLSPDERARLGLLESRDEDESGSEFDGQADDDHDVVEIPQMPRTEAKRRSLGPSA